LGKGVAIIDVSKKEKTQNRKTSQSYAVKEVGRKSKKKKPGDPKKSCRNTYQGAPHKRRGEHWGKEVGSKEPASTTEFNEGWKTAIGTGLHQMEEEKPKKSQNRANGQPERTEIRTKKSGCHTVRPVGPMRLTQRRRRKGSIKGKNLGRRELGGGIEISGAYQSEKTVKTDGKGDQELKNVSIERRGWEDRGGGHIAITVPGGQEGNKREEGTREEKVQVDQKTKRTSKEWIGQGINRCQGGREKVNPPDRVGSKGRPRLSNTRKGEGKGQQPTGYKSEEAQSRVGKGACKKKKKRKQLQ